MAPRALFLASSLALAAAALLAAAPTASAGVIVPPMSFEYTFKGNLNDKAGGSTLTPSPMGCPQPANAPCLDSSSFGSDADGSYWTWNTSGLNGGGLQMLTNVPIGDSYTFIMKFALEKTGPGYKKIIDYKNRTSDTGFYFYNNKIKFYNLGTSTQTYADNTVMDLIVVRQSSGGTNGTFTVYGKAAGDNRTELISIVDVNGQSIPTLDTVTSKTIMGFFYDDYNNERTPGGKVFYLKGWFNLALTPEQIDAALAPGPLSCTNPAFGRLWCQLPPMSLTSFEFTDVKWSAAGRVTSAKVGFNMTAGELETIGLAAPMQGAPGGVNVHITYGGKTCAQPLPLPVSLDPSETVAKQGIPCPTCARCLSKLKVVQGTSVDVTVRAKKYYRLLPGPESDPVTVTVN